MRAPLVAVVVGSLVVSAAHAGPLEDARALLFGGDAAAADDALAQIIASPPATDDAEAHALRSVTRILRAVESGESGPDPGAIDSLGELLDAFGYEAEGRHVLGWTSSPPADLAADSPTGDAVAHVANVALLSAISGALEDLAQLEPGFSMVVSASEIQQFAIAYGGPAAPLGSDIEIAYADARLYGAALGAAAAAVLVSLAYDFDFDLDELFAIHAARNIQQILDADLGLLTLKPDAEALLETARQEMLAAITAYMDASERIRARSFGEGLLYISQPSDLAAEAALRSELLMLSAALNGCFEIPLQGFGFRPCAWLGTADRVAPSPRALLPQFEYDPFGSPRNSARVNALPDPTLGGILVNPSEATLVGLSNRLLRVSNDRWQDAIEIGNEVVEGTVEAATRDGLSSLEGCDLVEAFLWCHHRNDVWYRYTASAATTIAVTGCSGEPEEQRHTNLISIHSDGPGTRENELAASRFSFFPEANTCFDDQLSREPITLSMTSGQSVLIRVAVEEPIFFFFANPMESMEWSPRFRFEVIPEPGSVAGAVAAVAVLAHLARRRS